MFVDRVVVQVDAGGGGDGCCSFRRERHIPRGGPDGGDGGHGGSVIVAAQSGIDSLNGVSHRKFWKATRGGNGSGSKRHGRDGPDVVLNVPPGTIIRDANEDFILQDLALSGDRLIVAKGGRGGKGNTHFKSSTNRAPRQCTRGGTGESRLIELELKVIADVGLLGKPNAGKSTLLSRLSHARPEIADYPFTTKHPNLGSVQIDFDRSFLMADIPGLIEGASAGVGLGHEFLRHIERAGILVHLVEPSPTDGSDPLENYRTIRAELVQYDEALAARPEVVAVTKAELPGADEVQSLIAATLDCEVLLISSVTGQGLNGLVGQIARRLQERTPAE